MSVLIINGTEYPDVPIPSAMMDAPPLKSVYVDNPGGNGRHDLSTALTDGNPVFDNIPLSFGLRFPDGDFFALQREWNSKYHGKVVKVTTDDQKDLYLEGRCTLSGWTRNPHSVSVMFNVNAGPYWYEKKETVVTASASANPGTTVTLSNGRLWVMPVITPSQAMEIMYAGTLYQVQKGAQIIPGIMLKDGDSTLQLIGEGDCELRFRRGWL